MTSAECGSLARNVRRANQSVANSYSRTRGSGACRNRRLTSVLQHQSPQRFARKSRSLPCTDNRNGRRRPKKGRASVARSRRLENRQRLLSAGNRRSSMNAIGQNSRSCVLRSRSGVAARSGPDYALNRAGQHDEDQQKMSDGTRHEFHCAEAGCESPYSF